MNKKIISANTNIDLYTEDKENYEAELIQAKNQLAVQNTEKEKRAAELFIANRELALQVIEKEKRASELIIANTELAFQNNEKEKRAAELVIANTELAFQNNEKEKRAAELVIANTELAFQNNEKEKRAAELVIANTELVFQYNEKEKRAAELVIVNTELAFQNNEKEKRAAELVIANKELALQVIEKEKRASELILANKELAFQNLEKEKRAAELVIANTELDYQNKEKEKRATELLIANKELESFAFLSSHDLQEPLRKIQVFSGRILEEEYENLSAKGKYYFERSKLSASHMQNLINDLLAYSRASTTQRNFENSDLNKIVREVMESLKDELLEKEAIIDVHKLCEAYVIPFQFNQLFQNLINNSLKFTIPGIKPHITIKSNFIKYEVASTKNFILKSDHHHISISDNGIGFNQKYKNKIFEIFQRLHNKNTYEGTGIGLTIVKKIVENHHGVITATSKINKGAKFDIYIPVDQN